MLGWAEYHVHLVNHRKKVQIWHKTMTNNTLHIRGYLEHNCKHMFKHQHRCQCNSNTVNLIWNTWLSADNKKDNLDQQGLKFVNVWLKSTIIFRYSKFVNLYWCHFLINLFLKFQQTNICTKIFHNQGMQCHS